MPEDAGGGAGQRLPRLGRSRIRWVVTVLAGVAVWFALVAPARLNRQAGPALLRLPVEALLLLVLALALPRRPRVVLGAVAGGLLAVLLALKVLDLGFYTVLDRPFDPLSDWSYLSPGIGVVGDSLGRLETYALVAAILAVSAGILVALPLAVVRLGDRVASHRAGAARTAMVFGCLWVLVAAIGLAPTGVRLASAPAASFAYQEISALRADLADRRVFATEMAQDPAEAVAPARLVAGLRGKNLLVVFVESYGRVAVEGPDFAPYLDPLLDRLSRRLERSGFGSRSGYLRSPTYGAGSWLAHSTLQSGLWVSSEQRYNQLLSGHHLTLTSTFAAAGWRTAFDIPADDKSWPVGARFYGFHTLYDSLNTGYQGPAFGYAPVPDQYTLEAFANSELHRSAGAPPVMAEIDMVSSHHPWAPLPHLVPWSEVGDGSVFDGMPERGETADEAFRSTARVRDAYRRSIAYSLRTLVGFVRRYGDRDTVLVVLGDHQPHEYVSGSDPGHDVPVSFITADPRLLHRVSSWQWQPGLRPSATSPTWRMDTFRDRFFEAFSEPQWSAR